VEESTLRRARESDEIRELRARLAAIETNASRALQIEQMKQREAEEKRRTRALDAEADKARRIAETREAEAKRTKLNKALEARIGLEEQMAQKAAAIATREVEKEQERRKMLEHQRRVEAEDAEDARDATIRRERARIDAERARAEQNRRRAEIQAEEEALERSIAKHEAEVCARAAAAEESRRHQAEMMERARDNVGSTQTQKRREKESFDELIAQLRYEEYEESCRMKEAEEKANAISRRDAQRAEYDLAVQRRREREERDREEKQQFSQELMAQLAEQDRIEQMSAQKRRMKLLEHSREVRALADAKFAQRDAELKRDALERDALERERSALDATIERERQNLLAQCVAIEPSLSASPCQ
jgi:hypothetical protein